MQSTEPPASPQGDGVGDLPGRWLEPVALLACGTGSLPRTETMYTTRRKAFSIVDIISRIETAAARADIGHIAPAGACYNGKRRTRPDRERMAPVGGGAPWTGRGLPLAIRHTMG